MASLGIIMSTTGKPFSTPPAWRVIKLAFDAPAKDASAEERLAFEVRNVAVFNGPNFLPSDGDLRNRVQQLAERCTYPPGMLRQFDAVLGTGSLLAYSKAITAPTVVLHGSADPMMRLRNGRAVAAAIPGARFVRGRRHGTRSSRAGVAADRRDPHRELRPRTQNVVALTPIGTCPQRFGTLTQMSPPNIARWPSSIGCPGRSRRPAWEQRIGNSLAPPLRPRRTARARSLAAPTMKQLPQLSF